MEDDAGRQDSVAVQWIRFYLQFCDVTINKQQGAFRKIEMKKASEQKLYTSMTISVILRS
ncbi:TPA: hypothetical protein JD344_21190 [Serratia marcescens]|nr:hypothetical protein AM681_14610 [Serratia marcescens]AVU40878.1 hypothetical protein AS658_14460 [Serratia marcescens]HAU5721091.1 hypothetical protein [Serratia marcescens]HAU5741154.1 hypothetical protein [Serratia marcescens]HAU5746934.1 hypothetical protein [Serratia marcescens]